MTDEPATAPAVTVAAATPERVAAAAPERVAGAARELVAALTARGLTVAVAESLTGGAVTAALVDVPGASRVLRGGVVAYATDLKSALLGVEPELLKRVGAVDPRVAVRMAQGVRLRLGADLGLATTGVAGPTGQDGRPPGEVHVAVAWGDGADVRSLQLAGDRAAVRRQACDAVLGCALGVLDGRSAARTHTATDAAAAVTGAAGAAAVSATDTDTATDTATGTAPDDVVTEDVHTEGAVTDDVHTEDVDTGGVRREHPAG